MNDSTLQTVGNNLQTMAPLVISAVAKSAMATTPQGAALLVGATILEALIQANAAGADEIVAMYEALSPQIAAGQSAIDAAAAQNLADAAK
jgi:hypothetical protein